MPLSIDQVYDICLASDNKGNCCKYLSQDSGGSDFHCLKKTEYKKDIDYETNLNAKKDPTIPQGDNCPGYPVFQHLIVGYDQKNS
jgi:hypothetical protein